MDLMVVPCLVLVNPTNAVTAHRFLLHSLLHAQELTSILGTNRLCLPRGVSSRCRYLLCSIMGLAPGNRPVNLPVYGDQAPSWRSLIHSRNLLNSSQFSYILALLGIGINI